MWLTLTSPYYIYSYHYIKYFKYLEYIINYYQTEYQFFHPTPPFGVNIKRSDLTYCEMRVWGFPESTWEEPLNMLFNPLRPNKTLNVISNYLNHMGGVMVSMLAWNVVDPEFKP